MGEVIKIFEWTVVQSEVFEMVQGLKQSLDVYSEILDLDAVQAKSVDLPGTLRCLNTLSDLVLDFFCHASYRTSEN